MMHLLHCLLFFKEAWFQFELVAVHSPGMSNSWAQLRAGPAKTQPWCIYCAAYYSSWKHGSNSNWWLFISQACPTA